MLVALVGCQAVPQKDTATPSATNLVVSQAQLDFGTVTVGQTAERTATIIGTGIGGISTLLETHKTLLDKGYLIANS